MKLAHRWLADYVDLPEAPEEIARRLTAAGLTVEQIERGEHGAVYDIEVTTNRVDAMNHFGLARELATIFDRPLRSPEAQPAEGSEPASAAVAITIEDERCVRYVGRVIRGVTVGPSPSWLRERLKSIGARSINNVVDITNFVLWELGQPLHAFDLDRLAGGKIVVRAGRAGETLRTLDGIDRELSPETLVIADPRNPVALAGVMGGLASEVTTTTTNVLLESAHFDPKAVRRGARALGMHTDASHRFERGADPEGCAVAAARGAQLIAEVGGGMVLRGEIDVRSRPASAFAVSGRLELVRLRRFLGTEVPGETVERWFRALGFELRAEGEGIYRVTVPSWRYYDVQPLRPDGGCYEADLFEEVARLHGLDAIPATIPASRGSDAPPNAVVVRRHGVREHLAASGFAEAVSYAFHDPAELAALPTLRPGALAVELANPLSERYSVMRQSLLPGLLESALFNLRRGATAVRLFEVGRGFFGTSSEPQAFPEEVELVALLCGGTVGGPWEGQRELDFFALKGVVESLAATLGLELEFRPTTLPGMMAGATAEMLAGGRVVGVLGRLERAEAYPLFAAELELPLARPTAVAQVQAPSRFPGVAADLTMTHALETPWSALREAITELAPPLLAGFSLRDRYQGQGVPDSAVNTTIAFSYQATDRSLTQEEVNAAHAELSARLRDRFGWSN